MTHVVSLHAVFVFTLRLEVLLTGYKAGLLLLWLTNKDIMTFTSAPVLFLQHQLTKSSVRFI